MISEGELYILYDFIFVKSSNQNNILTTKQSGTTVYTYVLQYEIIFRECPKAYIVISNNNFLMYIQISAVWVEW